jgi:hypothetical protein
MSSVNASALGSLSRLVYGTGRDSMSPLVLPTPLIANPDGEAFTIVGAITHQYQASARVDFIRFLNNEVVARLHINESKKGQGMMLEFVQRDRITRYAFFDTSEAVIESGRKGSDRQVSILNASEDAWNAAAPPRTVVKACDSNAFVLEHCTEEKLKIVLEKGLPAHIQSKDGRLLAEIECSRGRPIGQLQCAGGEDVGLLVCGLVACMKLL